MTTIPKHDIIKQEIPCNVIDITTGKKSDGQDLTANKTEIVRAPFFWTLLNEEGLYLVNNSLSTLALVQADQNGFKGIELGVRTGIDDSIYSYNNVAVGHSVKIDSNDVLGAHANNRFITLRISSESLGEVELFFQPQVNCSQAVLLWDNGTSGKGVTVEC